MYDVPWMITTKRFPKVKYSKARENSNAVYFQVYFQIQSEKDTILQKSGGVDGPVTSAA